MYVVVLTNPTCIYRSCTETIFYIIQIKGLGLHVLMQTKFNYAIQWAYDMHTYCELDWGEGGGIL